MATWAAFEAAQPEMARAARDLLAHGGAWDAYFTTVAGDAPPRTHPVNVGIVDGRLLTFVQGHSVKARELAADGRYALHAFQDPAVPHEFLVRGRVRAVTDANLRANAVAGWPFSPDPSYPLYELDIEHALLGVRPSADDWPPKYTSWRPEASS